MKTDEQIIREMYDIMVEEEAKLFGPIFTIQDRYGATKPSRETPLIDPRVIFIGMRAYEKANKDAR